MRNFQQKMEFKSIMQSVPVLVVLIIVLLFFAWGVIRFMIKLNETSKNRKIAEMKVSELTQAKMKLSSDIESLNTERGLEENIREKFGLAKEGENLIIILDDKNALNLKDKKPNWFTLFLSKWFK